VDQLKRDVAEMTIRVLALPSNATHDHNWPEPDSGEDCSIVSTA